MKRIRDLPRSSKDACFQRKLTEVYQNHDRWYNDVHGVTVRGTSIPPSSAITGIHPLDKLRAPLDPVLNTHEKLLKASLLPITHFGRASVGLPAATDAQIQAEQLRFIERWFFLIHPHGLQRFLAHIQSLLQKHKRVMNGQAARAEEVKNLLREFNTQDQLDMLLQTLLELQNSLPVARPSVTLAESVVAQAQAACARFEAVVLQPLNWKLQVSMRSLRKRAPSFNLEDVVWYIEQVQKKLASYARVRSGSLLVAAHQLTELAVDSSLQERVDGKAVGNIAWLLHLSARIGRSLKCSGTVHVYRGLNARSAKDSVQQSAKLAASYQTVGARVLQESILQTSHNPRVSLSFSDPSCCLLHFHLPPGYPFLCVENLSGYPNEEEVMLPLIVNGRRASWIVKSVEKYLMDDGSVMHVSNLVPDWSAKPTSREESDLMFFSTYSSQLAAKDTFARARSREAEDAPLSTGRPNLAIVLRRR